VSRLRPDLHDIVCCELRLAEQEVAQQAVQILTCLKKKILATC